MSETTSYTRLGSWRELEGKTIKAVLTYVTDWSLHSWPLILVTDDGGFLTAHGTGVCDDDGDICVSIEPGGPSGSPDALHEFAHPVDLLERGILNIGECQYWLAVKDKLATEKKASNAAYLREQICRLQQELNQLEGSA